MVSLKSNTGSYLFNILCVASLGVASHIRVTIAASDDAHGVFQFSPESLSVNGTEPEDGHSSVVLQVSVIQSVKIRCILHHAMFTFSSLPGGSVLW